MKMIDGEKVAIEASNCGKRLKVKIIAGLYAEAIGTLEQKNSVIQECKAKCGDDLFAQMQQTVITFFALNLLAKTHSEKEFKEIFEKCQVDEKQTA